jgi:hypothetical protein
MKNNTRTALWICFSLLLSTSLASRSHAQRHVDTASSNGCFRQPVTPIASIPTLHSDMNFDCLMGYIYFDSLCRSITSRRQLDSLAGRLRSWDTLKILARFLYRMTEYDADLFEEYLNAAVSLNPLYHLTPGVVRAVLLDRMDSVLGKRNKLTLLSEASAILRIHVDAVFGGVDSSATIPVDPLPVRCVFGSVVDVIKGIHWRQGAQPPESPKVRLLTASPEVNFVVSPYWHKIHVAEEDNWSIGVDSSGSTTVRCDSCYGSNAVQAGKNYVVFLRSVFNDYNGTNSYYDYFPKAYYSQEGGIFEIDASNNVLIPSNYFGYGTSVPLATFLSALHSDISSITSH